jgi:alpha-glucosidase
MKKSILRSLFLIFVCSSFAIVSGWAQVKVYEVKSPDGKITVTVNTGKETTWQVSHEETKVITPSVIALTLSANDVLGRNVKVAKASTKKVDSSFDTPFYKKSKVTDRYNQLLLQCSGNYGMEFRVYDDGAAYRFVRRCPPDTQHHRAHLHLSGARKGDVEG